MSAGALLAAAVLLAGDGVTRAGACAGRAHAPGSPDGAPAARGNGGNGMIELIQDLIRMLSQDRLTLGDIAGRVGAVVHDPGGLQPLELQAQLPGVRRAQLARDPVSGLPYLLDLELAADARPTVKALKAALGNYQRAITDRGRPREVLFYPPTLATPWTVVVIAQLAEGGDGLDDATATRLALRRDPVANGGTPSQ